MKIPLRYGLMIACGVMAWELIARSTFTNPQSLVHTLGGPAFRNVLQFAMLYLGLKALERERGRPTFKAGIKTGVAISFVYAIAASLLFVGVLALIGTSWIARQSDAGEVPITGIAIGASAALFFGAMMFGLIYSTLISFFLAQRSDRG